MNYLRIVWLSFLHGMFPSKCKPYPILHHDGYAAHTCSICGAYTNKGM